MARRFYCLYSFHAIEKARLLGLAEKLNLPLRTTRTVGVGTAGGCGVRSFPHFVSLLFIERRNERMTIVQKFRDDRQIVIAETVTVFPFFTILETSDHDHVIDRAFRREIPPDGRLDAPVADGVNGPVGLGFRQNLVLPRLRCCTGHENLLSG